MLNSKSQRCGFLNFTLCDQSRFRLIFCWCKMLMSLAKFSTLGDLQTDGFADNHEVKCDLFWSHKVKLTKIKHVTCWILETKTDSVTFIPSNLFWRVVLSTVSQIRHLEVKKQSKTVLIPPRLNLWILRAQNKVSQTKQPKVTKTLTLWRQATLSRFYRLLRESYWVQTREATTTYPYLFSETLKRHLF
jgi:hypothetical protein